LVVLAAAAYGGQLVVRLALSAPALQVSRIVVRGNDRLATGEVLSLLDGLKGESIVLADLAAWRRRLLASPWVADAVFRRVLPSLIEVYVHERRPMGLGRLNGELYLVDERGTIIDDYGPNYAEFDLPIIDGLAVGTSATGLAIDEVRADLAARLIDGLRPRQELLRRVSQIDVRDPRDAVVILDGDPALLHVGESQFLTRLQSYTELAPELRRWTPAIDYVDLRFDERLYVRPSPKGDAPGRGPRGGQ
jgi:cell division septal protein FtsQ